MWRSNEAAASELPGGPSRSPRRRIGTPRAVVAAGCLVLAFLGARGATADGGAPDTLVVVNGEAITSADLDALLLQTHETAGAQLMASMDVGKLLDKAIHDRLLIQEARAMGLQDEPEVREAAEEKRAQSAVRAFVAARFHPPDTVDEASVRAYFQQYYWKIQLRQISLRTQEQAAHMRAAIEAGAPMDSLALASSLDSHRYQGGLHHLKYWADVENPLRGPLGDAQTGDLVGPFPYKEAYTVVRVERREGVDEDAYPRYEDSIHQYLVSERKRAAWRSFLDDLRGGIPVTVDDAALGRIRDDADHLFSAEFITDSDAPVLRVDDAHVASEARFRKELSHAAMNDGTAAFEDLLARTLDKVSDDLVLDVAAERAGFFEDPAVQAEYARALDQLLIEAYLNVTIVPRIAFNRAEFQDYYDSNQERFREPDQVRLPMLIVADEAKIREIEARLADGADFDFVRERYHDVDLTGGAKEDWISVAFLSEAIQEQLAGMQVGDTSRAILIPSGWMVFKLEARQAGRVKTLEEVEMQIRQVMFQRKFNEQMDRDLALLKERSEIVRYQDRIDRYFGSGS
jgi:hypothetical protein